MIVDAIDKINHMTAWLQALIDLMGEEDRGQGVRLSRGGLDGFMLMLMHIEQELRWASDRLGVARLRKTP
jgi:hypothetical protein